MSGIQLLLLTGIAFLALYFILRIRNRLMDILLFGGLAAIAIVFVLWPGLTNIIAHALGVGRGTDLVIYVSILLFWFVILKLYLRTRRLEQAVTNLLRENALKTAVDFSKTGTDEKEK